MKNIIVSLILTTLFSLPSYAQILILTPTSKIGVQSLSFLVNAPGISSVANFFSVTEQEYLLENNVISAESLKISVEDKAEFESWAKDNMQDVQIDTNFVINLNSTHDPLFSEQWGLQNNGLKQEVDISDIRVVELNGKKGADIGLQNLPKESSDDILVAILDTGIDYTHPDLKNVIYKNSLECEALLKYAQCLDSETAASCDKKWANYDADNNGYPLDCSGWNVLGNGSPLSRVKGSNDASDTIGHGTHIAGVIAAQKNQFGVEGVLSRVKILPVKVMGDVNVATSEQVPSTDDSQLGPVKSYADLFARGLLYAIRSGAKVINMSLGWSRGVDSALMRDLVKLAISKNIVIVAAAGNDSTSFPIYPCTYDGVICVGSFSADGSISHFSNYGTSVDIAAPGQKILSTWPMKLTPRYYTERKGYEFMNGTSMATPFVVGAMARLLNAGYTPNESYSRLMLGAKKSENFSLEDGVKKYTLSGNLHLSSSFQLAPQPLLLPIKKGSHYLVWDGVSTTLPLALKLKNFWKTARDVTIKLKIKTKGDDFSLSEDTFRYKKVKSGQIITMDTSLIAKTHSIGSEIVISAAITDSEGHKWNTLFLAEIIVPVTNSRHHPSEVAINFPNGFKITDKQEVKSFTKVSSSDVLSYLIIEKERRFVKLSKLSVNRTNESVSISKPFTFTGRSEKILGFWQLDIDGNGTDEYVIAERATKTRRSRENLSNAGRERGTSNLLTFYYFDKDFKPFSVKLLGQNSSKISYDNKHATIDKNFKWIRNHGILVPAWIGNGDDLQSLNRPFNPWVTQVDTKGTFLYFFDTNKLNSVVADKSLRIISFLEKDADSKTTLLFAKGEGFEYEFFTQSFQDISELTELDGAELYFSNEAGERSYLMIGGLDNEMVTGDSHSSSFYDISKDGGLYVGTWGDDHTSQLLSLDVSTAVDPLHAVAGVFKIDKKISTFAIGKYEVRYFEEDQMVAQTTLKRFSFMPGMTFDSFLYPVIMDGVTQLPALYFPGGLGVSLSSEIIVPKRDEKVMSLYRPALYRILATDGCQELNHIQNYGKTELVFICEKQIRTIPLKIN